MYLVYHFAEQIPEFGSLVQYLTEVCEASYKALKQIYRQTNHIKVLPQIIVHYARTYNVSMREYTITQWSRKLENFPRDVL